MLEPVHLCLEQRTHLIVTPPGLCCDAARDRPGENLIASVNFGMAACRFLLACLFIANDAQHRNTFHLPHAHGVQGRLAIGGQRKGGDQVQHVVNLPEGA